MSLSIRHSALVLSVFVSVYVSASIARAATFYAGIVAEFNPSGGSIEKQLSIIKTTGVNSIRNEVLWQDVEREQGKYSIPQRYEDFVNQSLAAGIQPLVLLDYGNKFYDNGGKPLSDGSIQAFARYAQFVVSHFKGKTHLYEVWNEWSGPAGGTAKGTPETYAKLLKVVYTTIKAADPTAVVLGGAISAQDLEKDWMARMLNAGALKSLDGISIHPYTFWRNNKGDRPPEACQRFIAKLESDARSFNNGQDVPIYVTEIGWPTHSGDTRSTPDEENAFVARIFLLARSMPYVKGMWWYNFRDAGWNQTNPEDCYGLVRPDLTPKPALAGFSRIIPFVLDNRFIGEVQTGSPLTHALKFKSQAGRDTLAVWNDGVPGSQPTVAVRSGNVKSTKVLGLRPAEVEKNASRHGNRVDADIEETPILIQGKNLQVEPQAH